MAKSCLTSLSAAACLLVAAAARPDPATAQTDPRLTAVVQLAQAGLGDSARAVVRRLLDATAPTDSIYPEILYTSGIVAATEYDRRIILRRVAVEYSTSAWADDALLMLGQVEYAAGNPGAALAQLQRLLADYPTSNLTPVAAFWGSRAAADLNNGDEACRLANIGIAAHSEDIELKNQLDYQRQRCSALISMKPDSAKNATPADSTAGKTPPPSAPPGGDKKPATAAAKGLFVQVIAAPNQARADQHVQSLKRIGVDGIVVKEGGFFKVRVGPFATRPQAQAALTKIKARLGGQPFIVLVK